MSNDPTPDSRYAGAALNLTARFDRIRMLIARDERALTFDDLYELFGRTHVDRLIHELVGGRVVEERNRTNDRLRHIEQMVERLRQDVHARIDGLSPSRIKDAVPLGGGAVGATILAEDQRTGGPHYHGVNRNDCSAAWGAIDRLRRDLDVERGKLSAVRKLLSQVVDRLPPPNVCGAVRPVETRDDR
jgi:hypothetical protein